MLKKLTRKKLKKFLEANATDLRVLEIGGGNTSSNHDYTNLFPNRFTIDIDPNREPDVVGDAHELPFKDNEFEVILCTEVLEHLHSPWIAAAEMHRVLKPGGKLILTTRFVYPIHDAPHDYYRYTKYGLQNLFSDFSNILIEPELETFSSVAALLQRIGFQTDFKFGKVFKPFIYFSAFVMDKMNVLIIKEYGDIKKSSKEDTILTTGYYLTAQK